jgi:NAD(P)-dependent dehydrogenase (short-subunit alcohol dehydrogenase family)
VRDARRDGDEVLDVRPVSLDVTNDRSVGDAVAAVRGHGLLLDAVVNNAAMPGTPVPGEEVGPDDFGALFDTNVFGPVRVTRAFLPLLRESAVPRLVFVSSAMGSFASQIEDPEYREIAHVPYPASKAALNMIAVQYAKGLPDVLVTAVDPGLTATDFTSGSGHAVEEGAEPVIAAVLDVHGPSGRFMNGAGIARW